MGAEFPDKSKIMEEDAEYIMHSYARFPVVIRSGSGALITDADGKEYIDLASGIGVNIFGISDPEWVRAVTEQLGTLQHTSNLYYSEPCVRLAKMLCERTGMKKVFFSNSGAEANECAIKAARKYSRDKYGDGRYKIITLKNSFHGRTLATLAATGQDVYHRDFPPMPEGFLYADAEDFDGLTKLSEGGDVAAVMVETVQGEGGVIPLGKTFFRSVCEWAQERDILVIVDEVQTGNGRSGMLYAYMNYDVHPDIVTTAKGLGGGLPIGATMFSEKVSGVFTPGTHGSTFGGNPAAAAGAASILSRIDEKLLRGVREKGEYLVSTLSEADGVKSVTGLGLMLGIEPERDAGQVINECLENGVIIIRAKNKIRLLPPLNINNDLLCRAADVLKKALAGK